MGNITAGQSSKKQHLVNGSMTACNRKNSGIGVNEFDIFGWWAECYPESCCQKCFKRYKEKLKIMEVKVSKELKYSREKFEGYTHRFIVRMKVDNDFRNDTNINIYSNSPSYSDLINMINEKKSNKVIAFNIEHVSSKEQDEADSNIIDEMLRNI